MLETILLVPLVTTQNQATEGCKRHAERKWRTAVVTRACSSRSSLAHSRLCNTQHLLSVTQRPSVTRGFLVSWLHPPPLSHSPVTLYLTYLLTFDPVLHLFSVSLDVESILLPSLCSSVASPHTIYSSHSNPCKLATGALWTCARTMLAPCPQSGQHACVWSAILSWVKVPRHATGFKRLLQRAGVSWPTSAKSRKKRLGLVGGLYTLVSRGVLSHGNCV